jgi:hypothetical protein
MDILNAIVGAQDGAAVRQLGATLGLDEAQAATALSALVPALAGGVQRNFQQDGGLGRGADRPEPRAPGADAAAGAALVRGALAQKKGAPPSLGGLPGGSGGGLTGGLGSLLDRNGDGSIGDDVAGMLGTFLGRG